MTHPLSGRGEVSDGEQLAGHLAMEPFKQDDKSR